MQVKDIIRHSTSAPEGHMSNVAPVHLKQQQELNSLLECSYFGCYISNAVVHGRYIFEFITATCTFNQVDKLPSITSYVLSPSVTEQKQVFMSSSTLTYKPDIHSSSNDSTRKPSDLFCYSVGK